MIYGCVTDHSTDDKDATRTLGMCFIACGYTSVTTRSVVEASQDMPGQHRDVSGRLKDTPDGYTDIADTHRLGLQIFIFLADVSLSIRVFCYHNIASFSMGGSDHWITGCLDANGYKRGKIQLTSQIQCRCQYRQTRLKSCTTSSLTVRNGEAVTHHFSYDRQVEKHMGSARGSASY